MYHNQRRNSNNKQTSENSKSGGSSTDIRVARSSPKQKKKQIVLEDDDVQERVMPAEDESAYSVDFVQDDVHQGRQSRSFQKGFQEEEDLECDRDDPDDRRQTRGSVTKDSGSRKGKKSPRPKQQLDEEPDPEDETDTRNSRNGASLPGKNRSPRRKTGGLSSSGRSGHKAKESYRYSGEARHTDNHEGDAEDDPGTLEGPNYKGRDRDEPLRTADDSQNDEDFPSVETSNSDEDEESTTKRSGKKGKKYAVQKTSKSSKHKDSKKGEKGTAKAAGQKQEAKSDQKNNNFPSGREVLGRKPSLKKVPQDVLSQQKLNRLHSVNSFVNPNYPMEQQSTSAYNLATGSQDVIALPIEIPENVGDTETFRRQLSVRRGALAYLDPQAVIGFRDQQSYDSLGFGGPSRFQPYPAQYQQYSSMNIDQNQNFQNYCSRGPSLAAMQESHKRTLSLAFAIMTLALLSASASQLRFIVAYSKAHSYPMLNYFLISLCIMIEIAVGIGYVILSRFDFPEDRQEAIQSYFIAGLFIVTVANVIIAAFAFDDHVCELLAKQTGMFDTIDQSPN